MRPAPSTGRVEASDRPSNVLALINNYTQFDRSLKCANTQLYFATKCDSKKTEKEQDLTELN